jgi:hypothetical protein
MASTLEELEKRLAAVEQELALLRRLVVGAADETPAERAWLMSRLQEPAMEAALDKAFREMGIVGEAPGIEKLREMMREAGIKPEDNVLSRGIRRRHGYED